MSKSSSSFGGTLANPGDFAAYLAEVALYMRSVWGVPVRSVAPFNEPSAVWWQYPHPQEGCHIPPSEQVTLIALLRDHLDRHSLGDVVIATSDENRPDVACKTWKAFRTAGVTGYVGRINVHSYVGLAPWREANHPGTRDALARLAREEKVPVWMTEHGNEDVSGVELAWSIMEDLRHFKPSAWCYWQPVEHQSSWGFVEARFDASGAQALGLPCPKYFVFAHFTRSLKQVGTCNTAAVTQQLIASENEEQRRRHVQRCG